MTDLERWGMKSEVNVDSEKESLGREIEVGKMRKHGGLI